MMAAITVFPKIANDRKYCDFVTQTERIDVVAQDPFRAMRGLTERVAAIFLEEGIPIEEGNHKAVYKTEQRRLLKKDAALLEGHS